MSPTTPKIEATEFRVMQEYLEHQCGIHVGDEKTYLFETRLTALMVEQGCTTFGALHSKAVADKTFTLRDKIVDAMTTNETLWFRDKAPFVIFDEVLLRDFYAELAANKRSKIRIWSAASSTGQEPYSISMNILEYSRGHPGFSPKSVEIVATDISPTVLFLAKLGRYDSLAMTRGLGEDLRNRYFTPAGKVWEISKEIKAMVDFRKLNLQDSFAGLGKFDIVLCRNVLIYFSDEFKRNVIHRIADLLRPGGFLFLGASESLINYSTEFQMVKHQAGLYYKVKP